MFHLGEKAKWVFILCIQIFKCIGKLLLLFQYKERIISCPAILPHSRNSNEVDNELSDNRKKTNNSAFSLKRSGRIVRKVDSGLFFIFIVCYFAFSSFALL